MLFDGKQLHVSANNCESFNEHEGIDNNNTQNEMNSLMRDPQHIISVSDINAIKRVNLKVKSEQVASNFIPCCQARRIINHSFAVSLMMLSL